MLYSKERINSKFNELLNRKATSQEIENINNNVEQSLTGIISDMFKLNIQEPLFCADAHCKSCD
jgi:hypothetical protein